MRLTKALKQMNNAMEKAFAGTVSNSDTNMTPEYPYNAWLKFDVSSYSNDSFHVELTFIRYQTAKICITDKKSGNVVLDTTCTVKSLGPIIKTEWGWYPGTDALGFINFFEGTPGFTPHESYTLLSPTTKQQINEIFDPLISNATSMVQDMTDLNTIFKNALDDSRRQHPLIHYPIMDMEHKTLKFCCYQLSRDYNRKFGGHTKYDICQVFRAELSWVSK